MGLEVRDLVCRRGERALFAPVGLSLGPGQAAQLRGPNGAGKTTMLRALAGLGAAPEGAATLDGVPLARADGAVAYSGHRDAIKPGLSVVQNLSFWAALEGQEDRVAPALSALGIEALGPVLAGRLSAGQARRLGLARLMVSGARLWLMDEPTVSLDAAGVAALGRMVEAHLASGGMAMIATHLDLPFPTQTLTLTAARATPAEADPFLAGDMA